MSITTLPSALLPKKLPIGETKSTDTKSNYRPSPTKTPRNFSQCEILPNFGDLARQTQISIIKTCQNNNETDKLETIREKLNKKIQFLNNQKETIETQATQHKKLNSQENTYQTYKDLDSQIEEVTKLIEGINLFLMSQNPTEIRPTDTIQEEISLLENYIRIAKETKSQSNLSLQYKKLAELKRQLPNESNS